MLAGLAVLPLLPHTGHSASARKIGWEDLIPDGVPYGQIAGQGTHDEANDIWIPEFDENGGRTVGSFDGKLIQMPGYITPLD